MANIAVFFVLVVSMLVFSSALQQSAADDSEITTQITPEAENSTLRVLSRKRRYVVFPKGSSIQCVYCEGLRAYVPLNKKFQLGITLGLAWMLPTQAHELYLQKRDVEDTVAAALAQAGFGVLHRADMYNMLGAFLSIKGLKGRECIMRAVCEAAEPKQNTTSSDEYQQGNFMEELHKVLFTANEIWPEQTKDRDMFAWEVFPWAPLMAHVSETLEEYPRRYIELVCSTDKVSFAIVAIDNDVLEGAGRSVIDISSGSGQASTPDISSMLAPCIPFQTCVYC